MNKSMVKSRWVFMVVGLVVGAALAVSSGALLAGDAKPARVFEIRTYYTFPGRLEALQKRFRDHTRRVFEKHGMTSVGYWVPQDSPAHENTLIYIISHASREQAKVNWAEFIADPEWKKIADDSQKDGKIVEKIDSVYMDATDYSPIQ